MGFLELRSYLQAFVDNEDKVLGLPLAATAAALILIVCGAWRDAPPLQLWTLCVRTKRGLVDTGRAGGYCKDQVSFAGMMQLLQNRKSISFEMLHSCKLPWQSIPSTPGLQCARAFGPPMLLPEFISDGEAAYQLKLDQLVQVKRAHRCVGAFNRAHSFTTSLQANDLDRFLTDPP